MFLCSVIGHSQVGISYKEGAIEELGEVTKAALQGVMFLFGCEVSVDFSSRACKESLYMLVSFVAAGEMRQGMS